MSVEAAEDPAHFGAGLFSILTAGMQMLRRLKSGPDIAIGLRDTKPAFGSPRRRAGYAARGIIAIMPTP